MDTGKIINFQDIKDTGKAVADELDIDPKKLPLLELIDKAAKGSVDAAAELAEAYFTGKYGDKNPAKAKKWASYAAKKGSSLAEELLKKL